MHRLLLMVTHAFMLEKGTLPHCHFNKQGGLVGASKNALWKINNLRNEISDIEFEIKYYDANYCLVAHTSNIFINGSSYSLPKGGIIRVKDNDIISLFNYEIKAKIFKNQAEVVTLQDELLFLVNNPTDKTTLYSDNVKLPTLSHSLDILPKNEKLLTFAGSGEKLDPLLALKEHDDIKDTLNSSNIPSSEYKFFNPHIDSNQEYYAPAALNIFNKGDESLSDNLYNMHQDVLTSLNSAPSSESARREKNDEEILDPLFFIK